MTRLGGVGARVGDELRGNLLEAVSLHFDDATRWYNSGYTEIVKTAVSMPDDLFLLAEAAARKLRVSRSELYANAISEYLKRRQDNSITERLNELYALRPAKLDSGLHRAQVKSLEKDSW
jgi:hypothetical protein